MIFSKHTFSELTSDWKISKFSSVYFDTLILKAATSVPRVCRSAGHGYSGFLGPAFSWGERSPVAGEPTWAAFGSDPETSDMIWLGLEVFFRLRIEQLQAADWDLRVSTRVSRPPVVLLVIHNAMNITHTFTPWQRRRCPSREEKPRRHLPPVL